METISNFVRPCVYLCYVHPHSRGVIDCIFQKIRTCQIGISNLSVQSETCSFRSYFPMLSSFYCTSGVEVLLLSHSWSPCGKQGSTQHAQHVRPLGESDWRLYVSCWNMSFEGRFPSSSQALRCACPIHRGISATSNVPPHVTSTYKKPVKL